MESAFLKGLPEILYYDLLNNKMKKRNKITFFYVKMLII
jgi:hypothetical protein